MICWYPAMTWAALASAVMVVVSRLTPHAVPGYAGQLMLRMHLPEALRQPAYRGRAWTGSWPR